MPSLLGYYRHPTIADDQVVFTSEDDLWVTTSSEQATARRLTANPGVATFPRLSPDGRTIAFTGRDDGPGEVYVMPSDGGTPERRSWMGALTQVVGWSPDGRDILAATDWRQPFSGVMHLVRIPLDSGPPTPLGHGPARAIAFSPRGSGLVIGRNSGDPARWKRYRGGTAGTLWIDRDGTGEFDELIRLEGNLASPMWIRNRIYFLSDHAGHGNIYSCTPTGRNLQLHTSHDRFYVRFPSTDGRRIVYHAGADLYIFDPVDGTESLIETRIRSSEAPRNRKFVGASRYLESFDLHPKGHSIATVHRGGLFSMGLWEGAPVRFGKVSEARYRLGSWLADGRSIVALSDEGGNESLVVVSTGTGSKPRRIRGDFGRATGLYVAPEVEAKGGGKKKKSRRTGKAPAERVLLTNHRQELVLMDLGTGRRKLIDRSAHHRISGAAWSPDGKWIAYGFSSTSRSSRIRLVEVQTGRKVDIARNEDFFDGFPSFDPEGRYLYFISWRTFNPVYDSLYFDLGFPKGGRPYLVPLRKDTFSPFDATTRTLSAPGTSEESDDEEKDSDTFRIDVDGIENRVTAFPVPEGRYGRILGARGRALFTRYPVYGSLDQEDDDDEPGGVLEFWSFKRNKVSRAADKVTDFAMSMDARVMGILSGNHIRVVPADFKDDPDKSSTGANRQTGWIDLERIPVCVIPELEWRQMYHEAWRLQRDHYWHPDMSGTNWEEIRERYLSVLARVGTRAEFSDLMWEMQGELGTSHCYELGGDYQTRPNWRQGFLGADIDYDRRQRGWLVRRIPQGDSWDIDARSPLAAPGLNLEAGDQITAIGGESVDRNLSPDQRLVNMADRDVQLTIRRKERRRTDTLTVRTLDDEGDLRYRDWVEGNRAWVHSRSRGKVGYVHVPDMGPWGYAEFHRYYGPESDRDGLIIDVRFNRGGHVSQLLLEKLMRRRIGYDISRWGEPLPYPDVAPVGPMVALTNEYAGSDGDIFSHAFKLMGLGPLIGKRTWGGVVGIWPRTALVDGTVTTQPEFAYWFEDVGFDVENYGTNPDIEVDIRPQDYAAGRDTQLERGLDEVRKIIRASGNLRPDFMQNRGGKGKAK